MRVREQENDYEVLYEIELVDRQYWQHQLLTPCEEHRNLADILKFLPCLLRAFLLSFISPLLFPLPPPSIHIFSHLAITDDKFSPGMLDHE